MQGQISQAEQVPDGLNIGGIVFPFFRKETSIVQAQHRNDHAACTAAGYTNAVRVKGVADCVGTQEPDGSLGIDKRRGKLALCTVAELHEADGIAMLGQKCKVADLAVLVHGTETVAVEPDDNRSLMNSACAGTLDGIRALLRLFAAKRHLKFASLHLRKDR